MSVEVTKFKGLPILCIKANEEDKYPFSFGLKKAKLILENIDKIKKFVEAYEKKEESSTEARND